MTIIKKYFILKIRPIGLFEKKRGILLCIRTKKQRLIQT
ncbi:hypothetical protein FM106_09505 [Brachybacterium faecium]|nr:hypothetical protein FM106_09505 [Brachybacterium faecium]